MLTRLRRLAGRVLRSAGRRPPEPLSLDLKFSTQEDFASFLDDPRARTKCSVLILTVSPWHAATPTWSGAMAPLPGVLSIESNFDNQGLRASVRVVLAEPLPTASLVRAVYPVFYPTRSVAGFGSPRVGVRTGAPPDQRWDAGGGVRALGPKTFKPSRYSDFDLVIDTDDHWFGVPTEPPRIVERPSAPAVVINLLVHRPLERRQPSDTTVSASAAVQGDRFTVRSDGRTLLDLPLAASLTATQLRSLEPVTDILLADVGTGQEVSARVAELAAYGAVLHGAPPGLDLATQLASLVSRPFTPMPLLDHVNRSLNQVRAVMRGHARVLQQPWPSVSVILPTVRPDLLGQILGQIAAQDHPGIEVVLGCHGFAAPERDSFSDEVQQLLGPVLEFDRTLPLGEVLAGLSAAASGDLITKFDDDDWYGPHHVSDLVIAWHYSQAQLVGRKVALVHFEDTDTLVVRRFFLEGYRWRPPGACSIIGRHDLAEVGGWRPQQTGEDRGLWLRVQEAGGLAYSCSGPGYIHVRHAHPHTWEVRKDYFMESWVETTMTGIPPAAYGVL